ncbi:Decapping nuclease rai1 [Penicillium diatomitis]|uniref:Decapping nuclease n=1 Tax=Penicillium diatomitis TaxID=2819901 RepID=A0A9W9XG63_9EURO|nr:Decapping nuclease rai1 [Penicillium diatomitis]KAJ5491619.1 Decapping nuclease rai1 [Penicillium diatomitis]
MSRALFEIQPIARFGGVNTTIRRPREIACFSYDQERRFSLGDASMAYYYPPNLPADLNIGFDTFQKLDDSADEHLDALLETIMAMEKETGKKCETDVITWRGMMTKIRDEYNMLSRNIVRNTTLNASSQDQSIVLTSHAMLSTRFIEEHNAYKNQQKHIQKNQRMPPGMASQELMMYWGYKFEALSVLRKPWDETSRAEIEGRQDEVVNNSAQYCSVVKTGMGHVRMVLGGEVDAVWDCKPVLKEHPIHWVELKTSAEIRNDRDMVKYERKLLKFWAQSFLLGVPKIIVGFRDQQGIVRRLEELDTASIPGKVKSVGRGSWDGNICINFAAGFLDWLKQVVQGEGVWRIRKLEKSHVIEVFKIEETGHGDILSSSFKSWRESLGRTTDDSSEHPPAQSM